MLINNTYKSSPRVSILMPVYNNELYVAEAIESMLNQTFGDFELIVLDDCSSDNSQDVVESFTDNRIIYHRNEKNLGLANNLNVGLDLAKGEFIARMDGDDISLPTRLETQVNFLDLHSDIDLCSCGLEMFGHEKTVWIRESDPEQVKITMLFYSPVLHATSVWRRESFKKNNLRYDQNAFPAEDYDLWGRAVFFCKLVNIPQVLYRYRIHGIQVTKTDDRTAIRDRSIKTDYLKNALPTLSSADREMFIEKFIYKNDITIQNIKSLKELYLKIIEANNTVNFFDIKRLNKRLERYYQNTVFLMLKKEKLLLRNIALCLELRPKQILKLL